MTFVNEQKVSPSMSIEFAVRLAFQRSKDLLGGDMMIQLYENQQSSIYPPQE